MLGTKLVSHGAGGVGSAVTSDCFTGVEEVMFSIIAV